jgi:3-keto-5-aminohexanoate cleavage enzyme
MTFESAASRLLNAEMATIDAARSISKRNFRHDLPMMRKFAKKMQEYGVCGARSLRRGDIHNAILLKKRLARPHALRPRARRQGAINASWQSLACMVGALPAECTYTVAGIGRYETPLAAMTIAMGGNVRVGLEDNIFYSKGRLAKGSYELVERVVRLSREIGREPASIEETREILRIPTDR